MNDAWQVLVRAGLPDGAARLPTGPLDPVALRRALAEVLSRGPGVRERELLGAWLDAFAHHWPGRFAEVLGPLGVEARAAVQAASTGDPGRSLKLRRLAVAALSRLL